MRAKAKAVDGPTMTFAEFLRYEEYSDEKHEYHRGLVVLMPGGTLEHSRCTVGVTRELDLLTAGTQCEVLNGDMGVYVEEEDRFLYPDASIVCGKPKFWNRNRRALKNPKMVVEVLSPSTRDYDMSIKFDKYCRLESFEEYLMLEANSIVAYHWTRERSGKWQRKKYTGRQAIIPLLALKKDLQLGDVYRNFPEVD
jgi:Uma2 family endonuclease